MVFLRLLQVVEYCPELLQVVQRYSQLMLLGQVLRSKVLLYCVWMVQEIFILVVSIMIIE